MRNISFLFQSKESFIEKRDPRMKILFSIIMTATLIVSHNLWLSTVVVASLVVLWGIARLSWKILFLTIGSLLLLFVSTMVYHTLILRPETYENTAYFGKYAINLSGVSTGLSMCLQISGIILILTLLVLTTSPIILAEGLETLMKPLKKLKFPVHEGVMMFTISLRFLPILAYEFDKIRKAQMARGYGFQSGSLGKRMRGIFPLLMPMMIQSIMRAEELATAMNARCYQGDQIERTPLRLYRWTKIDIAIIVVAILLFLTILYIRFK